MAVALTRSNWAEAALEALAEEGLQGVAVEPLARRIRATKGSFYWHFSDRGDLLAATLELWERHETDAVINMVEGVADPLARLVSLLRFALGGAASGSCDTALLAVASDPRVAPTLERVTRKRVAFLEQLYRDLGLATEEAARHARLTYALFLGIGELRRAWPEADLAGPELETYLDLAVRAVLRAADLPAARQ